MKHKSRLLAALLAGALILSLGGCGKEAGNANGGPAEIPAVQTGSGDFQKDMHQSNTSKLKYAAETENGIFFVEGAYAYFLDKETKRATILCGKPECQHDGSDCNARLNPRSFWFADGKLYYTNSDAVQEQGQYVDYGIRIYAMNPDGTGREPVQNLEEKPGGDTAHLLTVPMLHKGVTYFAYCGILYAVPLGGDFADAEMIWGEKIEGQNAPVPIIDPHEIAYDLWADGDTVYFMVSLPQQNGAYKDTLFAYDTLSKAVSQVWAVPDADTVGTWEKTGVSVSQWYVRDGVIYFYLSGGDAWKTDLQTGETVKLADTHEKTLYGSAIFSEEYLCILNDGPDPAMAGWSTAAGSAGHVGGDTIYVYGMDGTYRKELSLQEAWREETEKCALVCCTDGDIYFVADACRPGAYDITLYCVNIESGKITEIFRWT